MKNKFEQLKKLANNSYSPYSNYKVAAIVVDEIGNVWEGVNVESISFGATICAERTAINNAQTSGKINKNIKEVHLIAIKNNMKIDNDVSPCGICRQIIHEQSKGNAMVYCYDSKGNITSENISKLLPKAFFNINV